MTSCMQVAKKIGYSMYTNIASKTVLFKKNAYSQTNTSFKRRNKFFFSLWIAIIFYNIDKFTYKLKIYHVWYSLYNIMVITYDNNI